MSDRDDEALPPDALPPEASPDEASLLETTPSLLGDEVLDLGDALNVVLDKGAVIHGEVTIAIADIDLIRLNLGLLLRGIATGEIHGAGGASLADSLGSIFPGGAAPSGDVKPAASAADTSPRTAAAAAVSTPEAISGDVVSGAPPTSLNSVAQGLPERINADAQGVESGLARLVLTLIEVLRKVLEHQAVRRMEGGRLTTEEIERLGLALSRLNDRMQDLKRVFGLSDEDLQIDLGPLGRLR